MKFRVFKVIFTPNRKSGGQEAEDEEDRRI